MTALLHYLPLLAAFLAGAVCGAFAIMAVLWSADWQHARKVREKEAGGER